MQATHHAQADASTTPNRSQAAGAWILAFAGMTGFRSSAVSMADVRYQPGNNKGYTHLTA